MHGESNLTVDGFSEGLNYRRKVSIKPMEMWGELDLGVGDGGDGGTKMRGRGNIASLACLLAFFSWSGLG